MGNFRQIKYWLLHVILATFAASWLFGIESLLFAFGIPYQARAGYGGLGRFPSDIVSVIFARRHFG